MTQSQFGGKILISESGAVKVVSPPKELEEQETTPPGKSLATDIYQLL